MCGWVGETRGEGKARGQCRWEKVRVVAMGVRRWGDGQRYTEIKAKEMKIETVISYLIVSIFFLFSFFYLTFYVYLYLHLPVYGIFVSISIFLYSCLYHSHSALYSFFGRHVHSTVHMKLYARCMYVYVCKHMCVFVCERECGSVLVCVCLCVIYVRPCRKGMNKNWYHNTGDVFVLWKRNSFSSIPFASTWRRFMCVYMPCIYARVRFFYFFISACSLSPSSILTVDKVGLSIAFVARGVL